MMNLNHVYSNTRRLPLILSIFFLIFLLSISPALAEEPSPTPSPTPTEISAPVESTTTVVTITDLDPIEIAGPVYLSSEQFYAVLMILTVNAGLLLANFLVTHTKPISLGRL